METGKGITVRQEDIDSFFDDVRKSYVKKEKELTEREKQIIIHAYENGYNKEQTAKKLGVDTKKMKSFYEEYKAKKE